MTALQRKRIDVPRDRREQCRTVEEAEVIANQETNDIPF